MMKARLPSESVPFTYRYSPSVNLHGPGVCCISAFIIQRTFKGQKPAVQARIRADVRLICAAPDLLDVLIRMVEYADDGTPIHPTDNLMAEARAVVAQAVGAA